MSMDPAIVDTRQSFAGAHPVELRSGFTLLARASVEPVSGGTAHYLYGVYTPPEHRGKGHARTLVAYLEEAYGPLVFHSENAESDGFWCSLGYMPSQGSRHLASVNKPLWRKRLLRRRR